jgi:hypothetical protein
MCFVEFFADKIPAVDSLWDAVHTVIRIPAGAALAASVFGDSRRRRCSAAAILGGRSAAGQPLRRRRQPRGDQHVAGAVLELDGVVRRGDSPWARCCGWRSPTRWSRSPSSSC